ncbi:tRNA 5-methoxyuridine(34)/uridine 5-oxyacetic acid(34) synthase CmoB [Sansalvadorimonas sp. 2012CJ34-2]|uniref:tRNA U34 carboxymethyltransferase n=1 Tax=Parendozoicomonas callyspongiae TaxID=2942213 RepID=A0ABT0PNF9_9GAMM|nr:tRNA 5-methoxyuridine(34)/uridine 5-oxyacetic acid(34) synthase CmoB [Sansalvadorimonas sp. 2012CJ34-2]MCL6271993.1 tRNA 5-methoxyuridine(34)/uridine 5-oxyacetic acid(34) synthase CmoB [Sansalvadorimonas sp. 2012CJ34-2]
MIATLYDDLFEAMVDTRLEPWLNTLRDQLHEVLINTPHGDMTRWQGALSKLPPLNADTVDLETRAVKVSSEEPLSDEASQQLRYALKALCPWRKGPFDLFGEYIDTEWRSDWKWDRLISHISPLSGRQVLDVGCGSGYHMWRMLGAGASRVLGVDPSRLFLMQFEAVKKYIGRDQPVHLLPLKMEDVPPRLRAFDTVFSMGVLYHRKSPIEHLQELHGALRAGGELVLETLVIDGELGEVLMPEDRYAMMRNVWFLPSPDTLLLWLRRSGFRNACVVDMNRTTADEQRTTEWMGFNSLKDFLDPNDHLKTVEGLPAPLRAVVVAEA